jgi:hypothetical protein
MFHFFPCSLFFSSLLKRKIGQTFTSLQWWDYFVNYRTFLLRILSPKSLPHPLFRLFRFIYLDSLFIYLGLLFKFINLGLGFMFIIYLFFPNKSLLFRLFRFIIYSFLKIKSLLFRLLRFIIYVYYLNHLGLLFIYFSNKIFLFRL